MAFRASTATQAQGLQQAMSVATWVKQLSQAAVTTLGSNVTPTQLFQLVDNLNAAKSQLNTASQVPGIAAYAQAQFNDGTYNISTEFTSMMNALAAVISWVTTNFPSSGGYAQAYTLNADGTRTERTFTPAQTAGLVTALNALIATIA